MDHISSPVALSTLSQEQQDAFWEQGFLVVDNVFTSEEVEALRAAASDPAIRGSQDERGYSERTVHLLELTVRHPLFMQLVKSEKLLGRIRPLIGDDIQLLSLIHI